MNKDLDKGQHFLINREMLEKEIEISELSKKDKVIEIGAGDGVLTKELVKKAGKVLSFEIDLQYESELKKIQAENLHLVFEDATKHSWGGYNKIVSNIPYYLGEKIISKSVLEDIQFIVLIVGENFKKILEDSSSKSGVIANIFYDVEFIQKIGKSAFSPEPRTNSWLVRMIRKKENKKIRIIKFILSKKGKTKNAIIYSLVEEGLTKNQAREEIKKMNLDDAVLDKSVRNITGRVLERIEGYLGK